MPRTRSLLHAALDNLHPAGVRLIDANFIAPGVLLVTVSPGQARLAVAAMLQAGFDATRRGDAQLLVTEPTA